MKIIQALATISFGDAVSNDVINLKKVIEKMGFETQIYAENIDGRLPYGTAEHYNNLCELGTEDIMIFHESVGTDLNEKIRHLKCHLIIRYHNITPPNFFFQYNMGAYKLSEVGLAQTRKLADVAEYAIAVSEFNKNDLIKMGYQCKIDVLPVVIPFEDYEKKADIPTIAKYNDDYVNILFVGRIVPNKKHEDIIRIYNFYKKMINKRSRLIFVGNYEGMENYKKRLDQYIKELDVDDVIFPGHIKFNQILAYYKLADIFICMSEHEGFCVPLVEAMKFKVPIIAYDSCAVPDTLSDGGILVKNKNEKEIAFLIDTILSDNVLKQKILSNQSRVLEELQYDTISDKFESLLMGFIDEMDVDNK